MWVGMKVCVHTHTLIITYLYICVNVCACVGPILCVADTWHFPWSAHFNDFIDMNLYLSIYHILQ